MSNILVNIKGINSQEFPKGVTPLQIMTDVKSVSKDSIICKVNGVLTDLSAQLSNDCDLQFMDAKSKDGHSVLLHSTAHLMAQAVKRLFPKTKVTIGPYLENRFYYDFDVETPFSEEDLTKIEKEMLKISNENLEIIHEVKSRDEAISFFDKISEDYKVEIINDLEKDETVWQLLKPWINKDNAKLERAQVYSFHACIAETWRKGNIMIAGDAAHQMPPFMGAGMGTGIRDVANISWKLDLVLRDKAKKEILDTYQKERHSHAKWTIAQTVTIGQVIEGFCAAAEGKEYEPKGPSYDVNFPHIPSGIYSNPEDMITGVPIPQPIISLKDKKQMLDREISSCFAILTKETNLDLSEKATAIKNLLNIKVIEIDSDDDSENRLKAVFEKYVAVLVRPDKYTYGGVDDISSLSNMIESLESEFSLNL